MGIQGLLPFFEKVQKKSSLNEFAGKRVAVDGNVWLHRGAFACAQDLVLNQPTTAYVTYFMKQVDLLLFYKVEPVIVFDGDTLPIKAHTNEQRRTKRQEAKDLGTEHLRHGRLNQAKDAFQKAVSITPQMIEQTKKALAAKNIKFIQAPYEADPQLVLLCKKGHVAAVISEDSDLLVHGCPTVLYKMNAYGECIKMRYADMFTNLDNGFDFTHWNGNKLRHWCILSGCDYLPSIPGVGLKTAYKYLNHYKTAAGVIKFLRRKRKITDPSYEDGFAKANDAFLYQHVYLPESTTTVHLTPLPEGKVLADYTYLGKRPSPPEDKADDTYLGKRPSDTASTPVVKKQKTHRPALGGITNTYGQTVAKPKALKKPKQPKHDTPLDNNKPKFNHYIGKENIAPWITALFTPAVTPPPRVVSPIPRPAKRVNPDLLACTDVITPSNADALFTRLKKRARTA